MERMKTQRSRPVVVAANALYAARDIYPHMDTQGLDYEDCEQIAQVIIDALFPLREVPARLATEGKSDADVG